MEERVVHLCLMVILITPIGDARRQKEHMKHTKFNVNAVVT